MATSAEVIKIDETTEIIFKDSHSQKVWEKMVKENSRDPYGICIVTYARRWAKLMQTLIEDGSSLEEVAEQSSYDADLEGVTCFMYSQALSSLCKSWKYGEELRQWHNKEYGYAGEGIVNPAFMTIDIN